MRIKTRNFGDMEVDKDRILTFNRGIIGFEDFKKYAVIDHKNENFPFKWLQSLEEKDIAFVVADPFAFYPDYSPVIPNILINYLGLKENERPGFYVIAVVPKDPVKMTVNLKAPIVFNPFNRKAEQIIVENEDYKIKHYIFTSITNNHLEQGNNRDMTPSAVND